MSATAVEKFQTEYPQWGVVYSKVEKNLRNCCLCWKRSR